ncbi:unnamed protein product [Closterium sp. NIES-65]|nr:unnamed protein product [Closterium sp. NIES-65]
MWESLKTPPNTAAEAAAAATTLTGSGASHSFRTHANGPAEPAADPRLTAAVASAAAAAALGLSAVHSVEAPEGDSSSAGVGSGREGSAGGARPAVDWGGAGRGEGGEGAAVGSKHTARWRVFTDRGRELFSQGRLRDAERYLQRAIEEAKAGFGRSREIPLSTPLHLSAPPGSSTGCREVPAEGYRGGNGGLWKKQSSTSFHPSPSLCTPRVGYGRDAERYLQRAVEEGRLQDAERYLQRAIEEAKAGFGPSDPHVASSCNNLAELYRVMGEWEAAERLFQEAAERLRAVEMPLPLAATLHNLGGLYLQQAQLGQGQLVHSQLGKAELGQAQLEKARVCYEEALKLKAKELGESHPDYANTMFHLAEGSAGSRGTTAMARRMMLLAQMLVQSASAPAATLPATAAINGQRQGQQGQQQQGDGGSSRGGDAELLREAERLQRRAIHAVEMGEGTEAPALAGMLASLAATLEKQGRLEEAREALLRSLHLRRSALGADHFLVSGLGEGERGN